MSQPSVPSSGHPPDHRLTARVPRYTSYPPANHFNPAVSGGLVRQWLQTLAPADPVSVYVHVPFCRRLCWFCACRTQGTENAEHLADYTASLIDELALVRAAAPDGLKAGHLHWGGGTPTLLAPEQMLRLGAALNDTFRRTPRSEFAVEIDPTEVDDDRLDALAELGLTRASVGVQDFEPRIQQAIGREQGEDITQEAIRGLRARGVGSLNIDLLYGLPFQTPESLARTLRSVIQLSPDRLALYGYAHVPWMAKRQRLIAEDLLPGPAERLTLSETAREVLADAGYLPIGIDHFARPGDSLAEAAATGRMRRNFQGYTTDESQTLIGLGASAVSQYAQGYAQNAVGTGDWAQAVADRHLPTARGHVLTDDDRLRGWVIELLMCQFRVDIAEVANQLDADAAALDPELDRLVQLYPDAVDREGRTIALRHGDGRYARLVAAVFDGFMAPGAQGYSLVI